MLYCHLFCHCRWFKALCFFNLTGFSRQNELQVVCIILWQGVFVNYFKYDYSSLENLESKIYSSHAHRKEQLQVSQR